MRPFTLGAVKSQRLSRDLTATHLSVQNALPKEIVKKKGPFLIPIADPLADEKMTKKVLKLAKKASKRKQTKRGTKEVVKSIRKGLKGCVIPNALLRSQHGRVTVGSEGLQVGADNSAAPACREHPQACQRNWILPMSIHASLIARIGLRTSHVQNGLSG